MGRRKIRHFGPQAYNLNPEEVLVTSSWKPVDAIRHNRPRLGQGAGRAGGARSATHTRDHVRVGRIHDGTTVLECPICRFGMKIWLMWLNSCGGVGEEWIYFWERFGEGAQQECEEFIEHYESAAVLRAEEARFSGMDE